MVMAYNGMGVNMMCRKNRMWGLVLTAFGLGLMIGQCLKEGFWCSAGAVTIVLVGFSVIFQK